MSLFLGIPIGFAGTTIVKDCHLSSGTSIFGQVDSRPMRILCSVGKLSWVHKCAYGHRPQRSSRRKQRLGERKKRSLISPHLCNNWPFFLPFCVSLGFKTLVPHVVTYSTPCPCLTSQWVEDRCRIELFTSFFLFFPFSIVSQSNGGHKWFIRGWEKTQRGGKASKLQIVDVGDQELNESNERLLPHCRLGCWKWRTFFCRREGAGEERTRKATGKEDPKEENHNSQRSNPGSNT